MRKAGKGGRKLRKAELRERCRGGGGKAMKAVDEQERKREKGEGEREQAER